MAQGPPPSDSEYDLEEYQYESEGEERLGEGARRLFNESGGNYRRESPQPILCTTLTFFSRPRSVACLQ